MLAMRGAVGAGAFRAGVARPLVARTLPALAPCVARPMQQSSFMGGSMHSESGAMPGVAPSRGSLVCAAGSMARTIDGKGSNKKRRTTSGYRARKQTPAGVKVLKARMKKGRHVLAPASQKKSGGKK